MLKFSPLFCFVSNTVSKRCWVWCRAHSREGGSGFTDAAVMKINTWFIWILSFSCCSCEHCLSITWTDWKPSTTKARSKPLLWRTCTPSAAQQCQAGAPPATNTAEVCALWLPHFYKMTQSHHSHHFCHRATHRNWKRQVATSPTPPNIARRTGGPGNACLSPSSGWPAHRRRQRTTVTVGMIHKWAQPQRF